MNRKIRNYRNLWKLGDEDIYVRSGNHPGEGWYPVVSERRVHGTDYKPYDGYGDWVERANHVLALIAKINSVTGKRRFRWSDIWEPQDPREQR
jgi:hypothetical protein